MLFPKTRTLWALKCIQIKFTIWLADKIHTKMVWARMTGFCPNITLFDIVAFRLKSRSDRTFLQFNFGPKTMNFLVNWNSRNLVSPILDKKCHQIDQNCMKIELGK